MAQSYRSFEVEICIAIDLDVEIDRQTDDKVITLVARHIQKN